MKLKTAKLLAKALGYNWIAVDSKTEGVMSIIAYEFKPIRNSRFWLPGIFGSNEKYIGNYSGNKVWTETLTEII